MELSPEQLILIQSLLIQQQQAQLQALQQHCLEQNYELDYFLQQIKQGITAHFMPPQGSQQRVVVLDVEPVLQSQQAQQCALARWAAPQMAYTVSTSCDPVLQQLADRTKVHFTPYQRGAPLVDAALDYNRFDLINAIYALDHFRGSAEEGAMADFFVTCGRVLLPGGHLLASFRTNEPRMLQLIVRIAAHCGLAALTAFPHPLNTSFSVYDIGSPYKRLHLVPGQCLNEYNTQLASQHHFIIFTRSQQQQS